MSHLKRFAFAGAFVALTALAAHGQSILTIAGGGTDDGKLATEIALFGPRGLAFDSAGRLYVVERFQNLIRRIDMKSGTVETIAGNGAAGYSGDGGPAKRATLKEPRTIFIDANDDLYVADSGNGRVRKIDAKSGSISTVAGRGSERSDSTIGDNGPAREAVLRQPFGVWIDRGNLYITEAGFEGQRVRKVVLSTGIITTIAGPADGSAGFAGDGGPALSAKFNTPLGVIADSAGNIYVADADNHRVRRIDAATGNIDTYAGGGTTKGDGGPASAADLGFTTVMAFDRDGNLLIDSESGIRRVDKSTRTISTLAVDFGISYGLLVDAAGNLLVSSDGYQAILRFTPASTTEFVVVAGQGNYVGNGLPGPAAILRQPEGITVDAAGNLFIADASNLLVRRVDAITALISTYAGNGSFYDNNEQGKPATESALYPVDLAFDRNGDLYIADPGNYRIKKVDAQSGILTFYAGSGAPPDAGTNNEGVPALQARLSRPVGISFDATGNLYIADADAHRVWKVDATSKTVSAFAGNGKEEYTGDGGPATAAGIRGPAQIVFDAEGNGYIADGDNQRIRKVTPSGTISTFAGGGNDQPPFGDGGPATQASFAPRHMAVDRARGKLYITDTNASRVREIDLRTSTISTIAGSGTFFFIDADFSGDNGPAKDAKLNFPFELSGVAVNSRGDLFISDTTNNRVRAVLACVNVTAPQLSVPADNAANVSTAPLLSWSEVAGAFRYDVLLDTISPPARVIASDLTETSFTPSNLQPNAKYFWSVVAKGDPFCATASKATSSIRSFTTVAGCGVGNFDLIAPANGAQNVDAASLRLSWQAASGAGTYDVYFGATNPPALAASGLTQTSYAPGPATGGFWFVVAHAACDLTRTATTAIRSFTTNLSTGCTAVPTVSLSSPSAGATSVPTSVELVWVVVGGAVDTFDVYFGTTSNPPLLRANVGGNVRSVTLTQLNSGTVYFWRLVSKSNCFGGGSTSTAVATFTTRTECVAPGATTILFAPASVTAGATYTIVWSVAPGLDADGGYLIERSTSSTFASVLDSQVTSSTAAAFVANTPGTYSHRVRALPSCDPTRSGPASEVKSVSVTTAPANIIFTVQPQAAVTSLGERIEDKRGSFTIENIGASPAQIIVGQAELPGSRPFFSIAEGGAFITLQTRVPRTFTIQYSGPPIDIAGSYQGVIFVVGVTQQLPVTPYAFVNLKVGGGPAVAPQLVIDGTPGDYVAFTGFSGDDDTNRPAREITIRNPGTTPMDLAAEVGPDVWLVPENGWNSQPLAAGASRTVKLFTRRPFAPSGSPLPRYTYFTVRTKDGASARLLVQDNDRVAVSNGRPTTLDVAARSFIVPDSVSRLRLTNSGGDSVQAELIFTPSGSDGFDSSAVRRAVILVPPNDVVTLTDPVVQVFGSPSGAVGQIEVRIPRERLGLIAVTAGNPVVARGDGATLGVPHVIYLPSGTTTTLTLAETSGIDKATVRVVADGQTTTHEILRYGMKRVTVGSPARIEINVDAGGGSIIGVATFGNATLISRPLNESIRGKWGIDPLATAPVSITTVVPVISGSSSAGAAPAFRTSLGFVAPSSAPVSFTAVFHPAAGGVALNRPVTVAAAQTAAFNDVMRDLFGVTSPSDGNLFIQGPPEGKVYAVLQTASGGGPPTPASSIPLPTNLSEALTSAASASQRTLSFDGLEQSVDPSRGTRWILLLNELGGASGVINVRLYEAGNRSRPIAEKDFAVSSNQQVKLDTIFGALGLDTADRRKDRTNVQVVVTGISGAGRVAGSAVSIDNRTGDTKMYALVPAVGSGTPNIHFVAPVLTPPPAPPRRRSVGH
jgi:sugar lactone lactonase YvrE